MGYVPAVLAYTALTLLLAALYLSPSLTAIARRAPDTASVIVINVLAGWLVIGWIIAMAMALRTRPQRSHAQVVNPIFPGPGWRGPAAHHPETPGRLCPPPPLGVHGKSPAVRRADRHAKLGHGAAGPDTRGTREAFHP